MKYILQDNPRSDQLRSHLFCSVGYLKHYYPNLGHGVGLILHEEPFIGPAAEYTLKENCVITVEPGIYIPDWGGVRIEDMVLVTEGCFEILTKSTKELIIL